MKRAETARREQGSAHKPSDDEAKEIDFALELVTKDGRYVVDKTSYAVSFAANKDKIKIESIEDFILFVEEVERQYPTATPGQIASEIRQIWFSDANWELLSAGDGISKTDIESEPNPIAKSLTDFMSQAMDDDALLGDIHGYIAMDVWKSVPKSESPTGATQTVSNILRDLYLVGADESKKGKTYQSFFEKASGKTAAELKDFIRERTVAFARPWFAKKAVAHRGYWDSGGWTKSGILENAFAEFDRIHAAHVSSGQAEEQIDSILDKILQRLGDELK